MTNCSEDKDTGSKRCQSKKRNSRIVKCDDPGISPHSTRVPDVRERRFKPNEVIVFDCDEDYTSGTSGPYLLKCLYTGKWSTDKPRCSKMLRSFNNNTTFSTSTSTAIKDGNGSIVAVSILSCVSIISFLLLLYLYLTRCRHRSCREAPLHCRKPSRHMPLESSHPTMPENLEEGAVLIKDFGKFVALRHSNGDELFHSEFDEIQNQSTLGLTSDSSHFEENRAKNRYSNISAFDHSRVRLQHTKKRNSSGSSDYINANFVSSFEKPKAYIACQGPLPETFADFWQMVWENNVSVIVMITNLIEKGRRKCDQYWPQDGREQYRNFQVTLRDEDVYANYTVRTLQLRDQKQSKRRSYSNERRILQYHYTQWPDHGTPEYILPLLTFIRRSTQSNTPIVVHCSAGVGRSGAYIMLDSMIKMAQTKGQVNINKFLKFIRTQRNHLVQTVDQYTFLFDALLCHFICGVTECPAQQLKEYVENLTKTKNGTASLSDSLDTANVRTGLENQFLIVARHVVRNIDYDFAKRNVNAKKNRSNGVLPIFCSRVPLNYRIGSEGSDYINASYLQGYRNGKAFIVTQLPLEDTRKDFWSLVWDYNCPVIITIRDKEWIEDEDKYWPSGDEQVTCPLCNVSGGSRCEETVKFGEFRATSRDFVLEATKDDYVLSTVQIDIDFWPKVDQLNPHFSQLLSFIDKTVEKRDGSVVIQDRFGSTAAAQLSCALNLHQQLANENVVDVFQTVRVTYQMRPGIFESSEDLHFLYKAMLLETHPPRHNNGTNPQVGIPTVEIDVGSDKSLLLANMIAENPSVETASPLLGECSKSAECDDTKSATSQYDVINETVDNTSAKTSNDTTNENVEMDESVTSATNLLA